ncbi:hypothetical protein IME_EC2_56 [Enterobacteria phage IME_EC2]|uniref:Uncharacterized protein n=1 Tax=Enterobacteria phage IME_EC2 TaxID=1414766 RepID=A0A0A0P1S0_9CAUD|nr:hypothetical protein HOQ93_gp56 [Enterobacteria phage IME_EC2]AGZ17847.1 hypothetical protein IME_EC2_56 [Enterobacteria phage IME_EC2]
MKDNAGQKSGVADISRMYVGPHQRQTLLDNAYAQFKRKGYTHNQATALAHQAVESFLHDHRKKQLEAIQNANAEDADRMAQDFIDQELGPKGGADA